MKRILATTYAVNPYKGSEDAMGWNYVYQAARFQKITAITRENNRSHIEKYMGENPDPIYKNIKFLYYDLPYYLRFWKKGSRGAMLYFLLWQKGVVSFIKKQKIEFDITHHLNFHNDWTPSFLWKLGKPFVWGPIGHHPRIPKIFNESMPLRDKIKNKITWTIKKYFWNWSYTLNKTKEKASHIWCMNNSVPQVLDLTKKEFHISPSVATQDFNWQPESNGEEFHVISAGRLVHMKGFDLSIRSFAKFLEDNPESNTKLSIYGDGPERKKLEQLITDLNVSSKVRIIKWVERKELMKVMTRASVFLFPSHEGAGMVVPEALSFGLPVVTIENCGPGNFIEPEYGFVVPTKTYESTVVRLAESLTELYLDTEKYNAMRISARKAFVTKFHWDTRGEILQKIYSKL